MRKHGVPNLPDPTFTPGGVVDFGTSGLDMQSPAVRHAAVVCHFRFSRGTWIRLPTSIAEMPADVRSESLEHSYAGLDGFYVIRFAREGTALSRVSMMTLLTRTKIRKSTNPMRSRISPNEAMTPPRPKP